MIATHDQKTPVKPYIRPAPVPALAKYEPWIGCEAVALGKHNQNFIGVKITVLHVRYSIANYISDTPKTHRIILELDIEGYPTPVYQWEEDFIVLSPST